MTVLSYALYWFTDSTYRICNTWWDFDDPSSRWRCLCLSFHSRDAWEETWYCSPFPMTLLQTTLHHPSSQAWPVLIWGLEAFSPNPQPYTQKFRLQAFSCGAGVAVLTHGLLLFSPCIGPEKFQKMRLIRKNVRTGETCHLFWVVSAICSTYTLATTANYVTLDIAIFQSKYVYLTMHWFSTKWQTKVIKESKKIQPKKIFNACKVVPINAYMELQGSDLSNKVSFVRIGPADWTLSGNNVKRQS